MLLMLNLAFRARRRVVQFAEMSWGRRCVLIHVSHHQPIIRERPCPHLQGHAKGQWCMREKESIVRWYKNISILQCIFFLWAKDRACQEHNEAQQGKH